MTKLFRFGISSRAELASVRQELTILSERALFLSTVDFHILHGLRTRAEQITAFVGGFSKIDPRKGQVGRHMVGCAIDFIVIDPVSGQLTWAKPKLWAQIRACYWQASKELKIPIRTLEAQGDLGHIELTKAFMPDDWKKKGR